MGAPSVTYFCSNGHIVEDVPQHYVLSEDPKECKYCGSRKIKAITNWWENDYSIVPKMPIEYESVTITIDVPIYNIKDLFC